MTHTNLATRALACLRHDSPDEKIAGTAQLWADWKDGTVPLPDAQEPVLAVEIPGRPERPKLVAPREIERRSVHIRVGHASLIHALTHIEFNAINLALDATYRFRGLPREYYADWLSVAAEEAYHFGLLREHLRHLGHDYGDFPAHDGLWQMCRRTAHDALARLALVPRLLEARGLDACPALIKKLASVKDARGVEILEIILRDEIGHVLIGNRWYDYLCVARGANPAEQFQLILKEYDVPPPRPPLHWAAREAAGFSAKELRFLETGSD